MSPPEPQQQVQDGVQPAPNMVEEVKITVGKMQFLEDMEKVGFSQPQTM
jgi:hypothetical protein